MAWVSRHRERERETPGKFGLSRWWEPLGSAPCIAAEEHDRSRTSPTQTHYSHALGQVEVVARRAAAAVLALLRLDGDGLRRAHGLAELAGDAALLARGVAAEDVLAAEAGTCVVCFRVVKRVFLEKGRHSTR